VAGAGARSLTATRVRNPIALTGALLAAALGAWIVTVELMRGMDAGPGTDLGSLGWFLGIWVTMTAAMMLPSAAPMTLLYAQSAGGRVERTALFLVGYLLAWTAYGLVAFTVFRIARPAAPGFLAWDRGGPWVAGGALAAAGLYELTPLKNACLRQCRSPLHFLLHRWRPGPLGAVRMGAVHGAYCVGCCSGLMVVLFALGVTSLVWMALVGGLIFAQKVLPGGDRLMRAFAVAFVAAGLWVALAPASVPGLIRPDRPAHGMTMP
jgi:predicted metal-binding membrane protein